MNVLIVGGGKLGYFLCRTFLSKGYKVTLVDCDHEECVRLARHLKATIVHGDGSDPTILEEAGAGGLDAVVAVTPNDEDNLVICQLARLRLGVQRALALVHDPDNEHAFGELGVDAFSTTRILANLIEQRTGFEEITNLIPVREGQVNLTEVVLTPASPVRDRALRDVALPENSLVACILRGDRAVVPRGDTVLLPQDRLIVVTVPDNHGQVLRILSGDIG